MIDKAVFWEHWSRICRRFNREVRDDELRDYHGFLGSRMSTEEFEEAARAVWASNRFFPRPADFLGVQAANEWRTVQQMATSFDRETWSQLTTAAKLATEAVGGTPAMKAAKDTIRLRQAWLDAYEQELQAEAAVDRQTWGTMINVPIEPGTVRIGEGDAA